MNQPFHKAAGELTGKWAEVLVKGIADLFRSIFLIIWSVAVLGISPVLLLLFFILHISHTGEEHEPHNVQGANRNNERS